MELKIIAVGKIKQAYLKQLIADYVRRVNKRASLTIIELEDERVEAGLSQAQADKIRQIEGQRILQQTPDQAFVISLEINGKPMSSEQLKKVLYQVKSWNRPIVFIIGGSIGLASTVSQRADLKLSFSKMTFPHQLMRVILLEQLERVIS